MQSFGQPEVKLGIIPGYGGNAAAAAAGGQGIAMQMVLAGEMISAAGSASHWIGE